MPATLLLGSRLASLGSSQLGLGGGLDWPLGPADRARSGNSGLSEVSPVAGLGGRAGDGLVRPANPACVRTRQTSSA
jgi:hypothetical protein